ncbi:hypothetical protein SDC9_195494 [bioreactor metagenome]|uniref:Uncharacterized protein n=1 Tax=bioreactor metagenome TaxID=1076179 RepID=A0A645I9V4_9ZZZZ
MESAIKGLAKATMSALPSSITLFAATGFPSLPTVITGIDMCFFISSARYTLGPSGYSIVGLPL